MDRIKKPYFLHCMAITLRYDGVSCVSRYLNWWCRDVSIKSLVLCSHDTLIFNAVINNISELTRCLTVAPPIMECRDNKPAWKVLHFLSCHIMLQVKNDAKTMNFEFVFCITNWSVLFEWRLNERNNWKREEMLHGLCSKRWPLAITDLFKTQVKCRANLSFLHL